MIKINYAGTLFIINFCISMVFCSENECYKTLSNCGFISAQERACKRKPLKKYLKLAKSPEDLYNFALKEFNFFDTLRYGIGESCELYANIFTFQLIESLLTECNKQDSSFNFKVKLLLSNSYFSWGRRGRNAVNYDYFNKEGYNEEQLIVAKISCLENVNRYFKKSIKNVEFIFKNSNDKDSVLNCQTAVLMYHTYSEYSKTFEDIASLYRSAPIPEGLNPEDKTAYKNELLSRANIEVSKGINLLEKFLEHKLRLVKYIPTEIDEIKKQLSKFKELKEEAAE